MVGFRRGAAQERKEISGVTGQIQMFPVKDQKMLNLVKCSLKTWHRNTPLLGNADAGYSRCGCSKQGADRPLSSSAVLPRV